MASTSMAPIIVPIRDTSGGDTTVPRTFATICKVISYKDGNSGCSQYEYLLCAQSEPAVTASAISTPANVPRDTSQYNSSSASKFTCVRRWSGTAQRLLQNESRMNERPSKPSLPDEDWLKEALRKIYQNHNISLPKADDPCYTICRHSHQPRAARRRYSGGDKATEEAGDPCTTERGKTFAEITQLIASKPLLQRGRGSWMKHKRYADDGCQSGGDDWYGFTVLDSREGTNLTVALEFARA